MKTFAGYPIGQQSFEQIRLNNLLYVDKTRFIEQILSPGSQYYFLARPRRFGKSLFLSTLECFFKGKRELFKGLYADSMEWIWEPYPVLYLDLNIEKYKDISHLQQVFSRLLTEWEKEYGVENPSESLSVRFSQIIEAAHHKTGKGVVILVDEYDKPLVNNLSNNELLENFRDELSAIYSNFKSSAKHLRLVFITGVSRFAHLTVFSGLNNLNDISFDREYSDICGITYDELCGYFQTGLENLAEEHETSKDNILAEIKDWYDGYRFSTRGRHIYNPFSVLSLMKKLEFQSYWIQSGTATVLMEQLKKFDTDLEWLLDSECALDDLYGLDLESPGQQALFYQTGYLTIKSYDKEYKTVRLGLPNKEVTNGFLNYLLPFYQRQRQTSAAMEITEFLRDLRGGRADDFMRRLQSFFADISYEMKMESENNFHNAFFILIKLLGLHVETERKTSDGSIDIAIGTNKYIYIIELKKNNTAEKAMAQIDKKHHWLPFGKDGRQIILIGASFSTATRTLTDWQIERV